MEAIQELVARVQSTEHGFAGIRREAERIVESSCVEEGLTTARALLSSEVHQARMLAVFILGMLAVKSQEAFAMLRDDVSKDNDWRVQEILAQAFDRYCSDVGY